MDTCRSSVEFAPPISAFSSIRHTEIMLTDIFADRYAKRILWEQCTETETRLLTQCFRIIAEHLMPYWTADGKESDPAKRKWTSLHDRLSMELGLDELAPKFYAFQATVMGKPHTTSGFWTVDKVCKDFVCAKYTGAVPADRFMKERISFVELAFRLCEEELADLTRERPVTVLSAENFEDLIDFGRGIRIPGKPGEGRKALNKSLKAQFAQYVDELNERFCRAGTQLNYHNGFIQVAADELVEHQIERPFWAAVGDPIWKNVDTDMKEALDRRDGGQKDPVFYAARALESTIKIISEQKGWTHGREKGAHNYIDNLGSATNGTFIKKWECETLKAFFTDIRNPVGHGAGSSKIPELTLPQTNWVIENSMSWIKSLIQRI